MEDKPVLSFVLFSIACIATLFFPYTWDIVKGTYWLLTYFFILCFLGAVTLLFIKRGISLFPSLLFFDILFALYPFILWQRKLVAYAFPGILYAAPVLIYLGIVLAVRGYRKHRTWIRLGRFDGITALLIAVVSLVSAAGLLGWVTLADPDLDLFLAWMPDYPAMFLILGGMAFALSNAFVEELIFRAVIWEALWGFMSRSLIAIAVQALLFGLWHWRGFPGGPSGMALVFTWGMFLGWIRRRSGGMLAPFICHVCADLTIFGILYSLAQR